MKIMRPRLLPVAAMVFVTLAGAAGEPAASPTSASAPADARSGDRTLIADTLYRKGDFTNAARELQWEVQGAERAGKAPGEGRLLLLKDCYAHLNDSNALAWSLEKLVTWYPKRAYWGELLDRTQDRP